MRARARALAVSVRLMARTITEPVTSPTRGGARCARRRRSPPVAEARRPGADRAGACPSAAQAQARPSRAARAGKRLKRAGLLSLMSVTTVNVWTGSPLMALWVGSRVQTLGASTMAAFATVAVVWPPSRSRWYRPSALKKPSRAPVARQ